MVLASSHTHSSTQKAAIITGTKFATVQVDSEYRLRGKALRDKLRELREQGLEPFFLTCTLGSSVFCGPTLRPLPDLLTACNRNNFNLRYRRVQRNCGSRAGEPPGVDSCRCSLCWRSTHSPGIPRSTLTLFRFRFFRHEYAQMASRAI